MESVGRRTMKRIMVLCVDRDDDLGRKARLEGPIVGRDQNLKAATQLGLVDAEDSDVNSILMAVGLADSIKKDALKRKEKTRVDVVTLTGHRDVGVESDIRISRQLEDVVGRISPDETIFVSDGLEDEEIIPLIREKVNIVATRRVVVKQSERLEETYLIITRYLSEIASDPARARIFLGLPGLALVIFSLASIYSDQWWVGPVSVLLVFGGYAFIMGFGIDKHFSALMSHLMSIYQSVREAGSQGRLTFYSYITSILLVVVTLAVIGIRIVDAEVINSGLLVDLYRVSFPFILSIVVLTVFGKMLDDFFVKDVKMWNYLVIGTSIIIFLVVLRRALDFIVSPEENLTPLVFTALVGIIICSFFVKVAQIGRRENWLEA
jgi:putative membrane protein